MPNLLDSPAWILEDLWQLHLQKLAKYAEIMGLTLEEAQTLVERQSRKRQDENPVISLPSRSGP